MKLQNEIFGPHEKFYPFNPSDVTKSEQDSSKYLLLLFLSN